MGSRKSIAFAAIGLAMVFVLAACSKGGTAGSTGTASSPAARTIGVKMLDTLKFDPATVTVRAGERVRFVVTNIGSNKHEFIVGDEQVQMAHEGQMGMSSMPMSGNLPAFELAPGATKDVTVTFGQAGTLLYGCHEPGHYAAGMVGTITISAP